MGENDVIVSLNVLKANVITSKDRKNEDGSPRRYTKLLVDLGSGYWECNASGDWSQLSGCEGVRFRLTKWKNALALFLADE